MKTLILFGAGLIGHNALERIDDCTYEEVLFCDNDNAKHGSKKDGYDIVGIDDVKEVCMQHDAEIVICVGGWERWRDVYIQCCNNKLEKFVVGVYDDEQQKIVHYRNKCKSESYASDNLEDYLRGYFGTKKGFYVDIGAFDPYLYSNTAWAADSGWRGINIEPNPDAIKLFRHFRENAINLNIGLADKEGQSIYYMNKESAVNTFSEQYARNNHKEEKRTIEIQLKRLETVFRENNIKEIDFMDIDVEGKDLDVLISNDWELYRPQIVLVEQVSESTYTCLDVEEVMQTPVYRFMKEQKYKLINKYGRNAMYENIL